MGSAETESDPDTPVSSPVTDNNQKIIVTNPKDVNISNIILPNGSNSMPSGRRSDLELID